MDDDPKATTRIVCAARAYRVDCAKLLKVSEAVKESLGVGAYELSVTLVGAKKIRDLNREYRGKDKSTDVLSFPQQEWRVPLKVSSRVRRGQKQSFPGLPLTLGDVVVSLPDAEKNAQRIGQPLDREVCFLLVHGILHLCGHDHLVPKEERRMRAAQRALMGILGAGPPPPPWKSSVKRRRVRAGAR